MTYKLNYIPSPPDPRDYKVSFSNVIKLPTSIDLSANCTPPKDQGQLGSCTAFATLAGMEYNEKKYNANKTNSIFSERFTYYVTRVDILGWTTADSGAYVRSAIQAIVKYGACLSPSFPYNTDYTSVPPANVYNEAQKYQVITYARFTERTNINDIKANLSAGFPTITGFTAFSNIWTAKNGVIPPPNNQVIGGHAVLLVGYDDQKQMFKFKNSWGSSWGDKGYGYLPYVYYTLGYMSDIWSIYTQEVNDLKIIGATIINPSIQTTIVRNQLTDILSSIQLNLVSLTTTGQDTTAFYNDLLKKYNSDSRVINLINSLRQSLNNIKL